MGAGLPRARTNPRGVVSSASTPNNRRERILFDTLDALRAIQNGRPIPEHVERHLREDMRASMRTSALRMLRRELDLP